MVPRSLGNSAGSSIERLWIAPRNYAAESLAESPLLDRYLAGEDLYDELMKEWAAAELLDVYNLIAACGPELDPGVFTDLPENIIVEPFVPQMTVLPLCNAFITHGGMNSTHEGLFHGVPLLFRPRQEEQNLVARRVAEQGAGILLGEKAGSAETLTEALDSVLTDRSYAENARRLSAAFRKAGGAERGIRILLDVLYDPGLSGTRLPELMGSCSRMQDNQ